MMCTIVSQVSEEYGDLEKLTEGELMEILKSLEADEEKEENSLDEVWFLSKSCRLTKKLQTPDYQLFNFTGSQLGLGGLENSTSVSVALLLYYR